MVELITEEQKKLLGSWWPLFEQESQKEYFQGLKLFLDKELSSQTVFPPLSLIFNAFYQTQPESVKVVLMGQDPYHGSGQAHGLSFSVNQGVKTPPSLKNIFKELHEDLHIDKPAHGCLLSWAQQGVLMLNATLTVREKEPKSHYGQGWELFTDAVMRFLVEQGRPMVFMLWGKSAQEKYAHALQGRGGDKLLILKSTHPSPFSAHYGFLGSRQFSKTNEFLKNSGLTPVDWNVR